MNLFSRKLDPPLDVVSKQNMMCMVRVIMISTIEELMQTKSLLTTWFKFNGTHERLIAYYGTPTRGILWWGKKKSKFTVYAECFHYFIVHYNSFITY